MNKNLFRYPLLALLFLFFITGCNSRQADIAEKGTMVMPFDLDRTTHVFEKRDDGGLQQVLSDDIDPEQIALIRQHLAAEAERFQQGDFNDPAMIHGDDMAGLHLLTTQYEKLTITYKAIENGAEITYIAKEANLTSAIHVWFDAQVFDHGAHAQDHQ